MAPSARDRISVDLRGLKAALVAQARTERVAVSAVVRRAVERELGLGGTAGEGGVNEAPEPAQATVKLSLCLTRAEAEQFVAGARRAGLSRGAYVAGLLADVPLLTSGSVARPDLLAALNASCAELSTLTRNLHHLTTLLRQGQVRAAMQYREMLDTLGGDVREHLEMAASLLTELRPTRPTRIASHRQTRPAA